MSEQSCKLQQFHSSLLTLRLSSSWARLSCKPFKNSEVPLNTGFNHPRSKHKRAPQESQKAPTPQHYRIVWSVAKLSSVNAVAVRYVISNSTAKFKHKRHHAAQTNGLLRSWNVTDSWSDTEDRPGIWRTTLRSGKSLPHNSPPQHKQLTTRLTFQRARHFLMTSHINTYECTDKFPDGGLPRQWRHLYSRHSGLCICGVLNDADTVSKWIRMERDEGMKNSTWYHGAHMEGLTKAHQNFRKFGIAVQIPNVTLPNTSQKPEHLQKLMLSLETNILRGDAR